MPQVPSDSAGGLWGRGLGPVQPLDPVQDEVNAERELRVVVAAVPDDRVLTMARGARHHEDVREDGTELGQQPLALGLVGQRQGIGRVGRRGRGREHLDVDPPQPTAEGVHHLMDQPRRQPARQQGGDDRVQAGQDDRRGLGAGREDPGGPAVPQHHVPGGLDAAAQGLLPAAVDTAGVDGIVVAGTGNGTLHTDLEAALLKADRSGVKVLRSTRCAAGGVIEATGSAAGSWARLRMLTASRPSRSASATAAASTAALVNGARRFDSGPIGAATSLADAPRRLD